MTTVDEAREALLEGIVDDRWTRTKVDALIATVRAEHADAHFNGYQEGKVDAEAKLAALREAALEVDRAANTHDGTLFDALLALRAALAATPAEDGEGRT